MIDPQAGNILIIDDSAENLHLLSQILNEQGYKVRAVLNGEQAITAVQASPPDLVLLDIMMPGMNGIEVCQHLKSSDLTASIPVIFLSALDNLEHKVQAFECGGVDYITKPFQPLEVLARVRNHLDLKSAQMRLARQIEERDQLIAELDAFAHTVAHDLKNPLTTMLGYGEMALMHCDNGNQDMVRESLSLINDSTMKMVDIIESLLLLANVRKANQIETYPLDMGMIVEEAVKRLDSMASETEIIWPESWPVVLGNEMWIEEVWVNYLSNAIKYGGRPPRIEIGAKSLGGGMARFWARDNGEGIPIENQDKLFTPFNRLGQVKVDGHGLGLSIVQRIIHRLSGEVGVESQPGAGSTFYFTLPMH